MRTFISIFIISGCMCNAFAQDIFGSKPPVTENYGREYAVRSGVALGGLGTGYIELRKDGNFHNWTIFNNIPLGTGPSLELKTRPHAMWEESLLFFVVRYQEEGEDARLKLLQVNNTLSEGALESIAYYYPWMTAIEKIEYSGRFPFVKMKFEDSEMPLVIEMEAFSPFIPHDSKNSALPGIYFDFSITSTSNKPVDVMILGSLRNLVGYETFDKYFKSRVVRQDNYTLFEHAAGGMDTTLSSYGTMGLASLDAESTYYTGWEHKHPYYEKLLEEEKLANIDDTPGRNITDKVTGDSIGRAAGWNTKDQRHFSSIAGSRRLDPGENMEHDFVMAWHFPNAYGAHRAKKDGFEGDYSFNLEYTKNQGHFYSNFFSNSSEVAHYLIENKAELEQRTRGFVRNLYQSDIPQVVLDQINSNLNTYITSSTYTQAGRFAIREGLTRDKSWGPNATMDVSLYGSASLAYLFPELQKEMMRQHRDLQTDQGEVNHGLGSDPDYTQNGTWGVYERIDLPGNYIQMVLRDYFITNDVDYLKEMWPSVELAIQYILTERDEDENRMPDMEGIMCSYDNFPMFGLASYIQSQWIAAMAMATQAAEILDDTSADDYRRIWKKGSDLMDQHLWNGEYYRLSNDYNNEFGGEGVDEGCLTDQLIGQWIANQTAMGDLFDKSNIDRALDEIMERNFKSGNIGLVNCTWPEYEERFPIAESDLWVDQANTAWTGVELGFAALLLYESKYENALKVIENVNNRYRKNGLYWDHQEFGGHYYRPMSSWGIVNALLGLGINTGSYSFDPVIPQDNFTMFFAAPGFTAHYLNQENEIAFDVLTGSWNLKEISVPGRRDGVFLNGEEMKSKVKSKGDLTTFVFSSTLNISTGDQMSIR